MKLEENMYVRTKYGITQFKEYKTTNYGKLLCMPLTNGTFANIEDIIKASYNLIDLVEEGDYVNGYKVFEVKENCVMVGYKCFITVFNDDEDFLYQTIYADEIKSIVTKEQFESVKYEL